MPTAAEKALLHHAKTIGAQVEAMRHEYRGFPGGMKGQVRLQPNPAALVDFVPRRCTPCSSLA